jgi:crotonobetainyl-CoA:carnitine CoA-transferase CaiB-like acyl-CoA transferase
VTKIERRGVGDDTRGWGPPFVEMAEGAATRESAYFLSANRGKQSVAIDMATPEGQSLIRALAAQSDVLVENFKLGDLDRYGLDYETLHKLNPRLIYCSISGFGRTGPNAHRAGYDFLAQAEAGLMSLTGEADGTPTKAGVGVADIVCGLYASNAILAALHARQRTGRGQLIDLALMDSQIAMLVNQGVGFLTDGTVPPRRGNDHPTIVPYGVFPAKDQEIILAIGNDQQFRKFVTEAGAPDLADHPHFAKNADRVQNRGALLPLLAELTCKRKGYEWLSRLEELGVPTGPVNDLQQVFSSPQVESRGMRITLAHPSSATGQVELIGNPLKFSDTPVAYDRAPPVLAQDTITVLHEQLNLSETEIAALASKGIVGIA